MSVASKNLYDLLGNDDGDSDTPKGPVKTVDKASTHTTKRNAEGAAPASRGQAAAGNRRGGAPAGNEGAFRDRFAGSDRNRNRPVDDSARGGARGGSSARVRGGRGSRFPRDRDDRHTKSAPGGGSEKQAAHSWGAPEGQSELKDEQAGEAIAQSEQKDAATEGAEGDFKEAEAEPEENHISYADYLAQQAEKKLALEAETSLKVRQANEGVKTDKKWGAAKPLVKDEDEDYFAGTGGKAKRERERKTKQLLEIDQRYVEPERTRGGGRGGRGGGGGRGGDSSRGFGRGGPRGGGGPGRGEPRGGSRGGDFRGGRGRGGGGQQGVNPNDQAAFPSLGS